VSDLSPLLSLVHQDFSHKEITDVITYVSVMLGV